MSNDERGTNISMTSADKGDTKTLKKTRKEKLQTWPTMMIISVEIKQKRFTS